MATIQISLSDLHADQRRAVDSGDHDLMQEVSEKLLLVLENNPDTWQAIFMLANCYQYLGKYVLSVLLLHGARWGAPDSPEIQNNLGTAYRHLGQREKARTCYEKSLEIRPDQGDVIQNIGTLYINEGCPEQAEQWFRRAMPLNPAQSHTHWNLGLSLLEQEQWDEGFKEYAWGIATGDRMGKSYGNTPWWNGEPVDTLVVYGEQGIGDEMMYATLLPKLIQDGHCQRLILDCHPRLESVFRRSFQSAGKLTFGNYCVGEIHPTRKELDESKMEWIEDRTFDAKCAMGNLPKYLVHKESDFRRVPYIVPDDEKTEWMMQEIGRAVSTSQGGWPLDGPPIALSWVGGTKKTNKTYRSINLDVLCEAILKRVPNAQFISIQYTGHEDDLEQCHHEITAFPHIFESAKWEKYYPMVRGGFLSADDGQRLWVQDKYEAKRISKQHGGDEEYYFEQPETGWDYSDFVAGLQAIHDLGGAIVTINNSTVHTCGAMGLPCFTLTPSKPAWRYGLKRNDMVWYPHDSVRQFRQKGDDWRPALKLMAKKLAEYLK